MHPRWEHPPTPRQVIEQDPVQALVPCTEDYAQTLSCLLTELEKCMAWNERVIKNVATVQINTVKTLNSMQDSLQDMTASFTNLKTDMIAAMRDMLDQHSVKQICDS